MKRLRVVIATQKVFPFHPHGGIEHYVFRLSRALLREGADVEVVVSSSPAGQKVAVLDGIRHVFLPPEGGWNSPFAARESLANALFSANLARYLCLHRFDVLHAYNTTPYAYLRLPRRRPVLHQPFEEVLNAEEALSGPSGPLRRVAIAAKHHADRFILTRADLVACEDEHQAGVFSERFGVRPERLAIVPVGIDLAAVDAALRDPALTRADLNLGSRDLVLISVNRLEAVKGVDYLLTAFSRLALSQPAARLILVGSGALETALVSRIRGLGLEDKVLHRKNVPERDLYALYALSDIYVSPTLHLYSTQSVLEAMACSLPVAGTGPDFWIHPGENGYLVPKRDPDAIVRAVQSIVAEGSAETFGRASRKIAERYDFAAIAKTALRQYEQMLSA